jgi:hypothetical protein
MSGPGLQKWIEDNREFVEASRERERKRREMLA